MSKPNWMEFHFKDNRFLINLNHVVSITPLNSGAMIFTDDDPEHETVVDEDYQTIKRRIFGLPASELPEGLD